MSKLSGIRDLDREILGKVDDIDLLKISMINKYTWFTVCDDAFIIRRLYKKYPEIAQYKWKIESWKQFFARAIYYISKMKEYYYDYAFGNFAVQYDLFDSHKFFGKNSLLQQSSAKGELALVIWCLKTGADIHSYNVALEFASEKGHLDIVKYMVENAANSIDFSLRLASENGHLEIVKFLVKVGANIHTQNEIALKLACRCGHLEVVKYLVEVGADLHIQNETVLGFASKYGHLEIVKYLVENGADIHAQEDYALRCAMQNRYFEIVDYLKSKM